MNNMNGMEDYSQDENILEKFGRDVTKAAKEGKIDPVIGRDEEIHQIIEVLSRKNKNNVILLGEVRSLMLAGNLSTADKRIVIQALQIIDTITGIQFLKNISVKLFVINRLDLLVRSVASDDRITLTRKRGMPSVLIHMHRISLSHPEQDRNRNIPY